MVAAFGRQEAAGIIESKTSANNLVAFDGKSRIAKVVRHAMEYSVQHPSGSGSSDGFILDEFGYDKGGIWHGPSGTRVASVRFEYEKLTVSIFGILHLGASTRIVPPDQPEDYVVPWPKDRTPPAGSLYGMILDRHQTGG